MIKVLSVAFVGYPVTDMTRARAFYEGLLGLAVGDTFGEGDQQWIEYDIGTTTLALSNMSPEHWKPSADGPGIALEVESFDDAISALRAAGVRFYIDPMDSPVCRLAIVADPDGNSVAIHRRRA